MTNKYVYEQPSRYSKEKSFGFLVSLLVWITAAFLHNRGGAGLLLLVGSAILVATILAPRILEPILKAWLKLGDLMGKVVSPLVLGVIFFVLITPIALLTRLFGRDELRLKKADVSSYWIDRVPPGPADDSFKNQF